jgi:hypothetical protein
MKTGDKCGITKRKRVCMTIAPATLLHAESANWYATLIMFENTTLVEFKSSKKIEIRVNTFFNHRDSYTQHGLLSSHIAFRPI